MKSKIKCLTFLAILIFTILIIPTARAENTTPTPVTTPFITIDPVGNHAIGDVFIISGTTNLPVTDNLTLDIITSHWFHMLRMKDSPDYPPPDEWAFLPSIPIEPEFPTNKWSANITDNVTHLIQGDYLVYCEKKVDYPCTDPEKCNIGNYSEFSLLRINSSTPALTQTQTLMQPTSLTPRPSSPNEPTTQPSSFPLALSITALAVIVILKRKF
jgi:hypothetical protein